MIDGSSLRVVSPANQTATLSLLLTFVPSPSSVASRFFSRTRRTPSHPMRVDRLSNQELLVTLGSLADRLSRNRWPALGGNLATPDEDGSCKMTGTRGMQIRGITAGHRVIQCIATCNLAPDIVYLPRFSRVFSSTDSEFRRMKILNMLRATPR